MSVYMLKKAICNCSLSALASAFLRLACTTTRNRPHAASSLAFFDTDDVLDYIESGGGHDGRTVQPLKVARTPGVDHADQMSCSKLGALTK